MVKRVAFLDYVRVFACFLVMLVHASENFYGAEGSTDMAGPQSFLADESDRLWVSLYDGFSRMSVPLFMIVSAFLLAPMKREQTSWQFYARRFKRILPPLAVFMILYSTLPMLWGQIDGATSARDLSRFFLNFPTMAGHFWFMYPLIGLYLFIPIISPWLEKATAREELFFIGLFLLSTCIPYLNRWRGVGTVLLERIPHVVEFLGLRGIYGAGALHTRASRLEPRQKAGSGIRGDDGWRGGDHIFVLCAGGPGRDPRDARA